MPGTSEDPAIDQEARLLGHFALGNNERAVATLIVQIESKEVLFSRNVEDPRSTAATAFAISSSSQQLGSGLPTLIRIEGPDNDSHSYRAISTDGVYLLYAEIERS